MFSDAEGGGILPPWKQKIGQFEEMHKVDLVTMGYNHQATL